MADLVHRHLFDIFSFKVSRFFFGDESVKCVCVSHSSQTGFSASQKVLTRVCRPQPSAQPKVKKHKPTRNTVHTTQKSAHWRVGGRVDDVLLQCWSSGALMSRSQFHLCIVLHQQAPVASCFTSTTKSPVVQKHFLHRASSFYQRKL